MSKRPSVSSPYNFQHLSHASLHEVSAPPDTDGQQVTRRPHSVYRASSPNTLASPEEAASNDSTAIQSWNALPLSEDRLARPPPSPPASPSAIPAEQSLDLLPGPSSQHDTYDAEEHTQHSSSVVAVDGAPEGRDHHSAPPRAVVLPPRTSSRLALVRRREEHMDFVANESVDLIDHGLSPPASPADGNAICPPLPHSEFAPCCLERMDMPHAVTTPDDSAWPMQPPTFSGRGSALADVPEEEDGECEEATGDAIAPITSSASMTSLCVHDAPRPASSALPDFFLPFPEEADAPSPQSSAVSVGTEILSHDCALLSGPSPSRRESGQAQGEVPPADLRDSERISVVDVRKSPRISFVDSQGVEMGWEADIDYCYAHAAEASCDYEWLSSDAAGSAFSSASTSLPPAPSVVVQTAEDVPLLLDPLREALKSEKNELRKESSSSGRRPSLVVSTQLSHLGLDYSPAAMTSSATTVNESEATTPSQASALPHTPGPFRPSFLRNPFKEPGVFTIDHACAPPEEVDITSDVTQEGVLSGSVHVVRGFALHDHLVDEAAESEMESCPSRCSLSKCTSRDSADRPATGYALQSGHRRDGSSVGSSVGSSIISAVPELVYSRRCSAELSELARQQHDHRQGLREQQDSRPPSAVNMPPLAQPHFRVSTNTTGSFSSDACASARSSAAIVAAPSVVEKPTATCTISAPTMSKTKLLAASSPSSPPRRLTQKSQSHSDIRDAAVCERAMPSRMRSQSDGTTKSMATVPRRRAADARAVGRNRSHSSLRSPRTPSTAQFSYVLFPTS